MLNKIGMVSLTVTDIEKSIKFYEDILEMKLAKQMVMDCKAAEEVFGMPACKVKIAHLKGCEDCGSPVVELRQFAAKNTTHDEVRLNKVSVSSMSFIVDDIEKTYNDFKEKGVEFISSPQYFEHTKQGFGKSKSAYFKDPDGIILELQEIVEEGTPVNELDKDTCISPSDGTVSRV